MKKVMALALASAMMLGTLSGCGGSSSSTPSTSGTTSTPSSEGGSSVVETSGPYGVCQNYLLADVDNIRSEERRVGKECLRQGRVRGATHDERIIILDLLT